MDDFDYAYALQLSEYAENNKKLSDVCLVTETKPLSVIDDSWELIDPIPDIRQLFIQFDKAYFNGKLACVEVKWSNRMTSCAGLCRYEGHGGLCGINLSQPLLKLRPRSDLVNTLLHEMIHAYLFVTNNNKDHNAHGEEFHKLMYKINKESGSKITVYHSFHDEVNEYRQHWWKCDGPCAKRRPFYGLVRRAMNRAPGPNDRWWSDHKKSCGGTFTKIKEPDKTGAKDGKKSKKEGKSGKTSNHVQSNSKNIMDFLKKSPKDNSKVNGSDVTQTGQGREIVTTTSFWNSETTVPKIISSFQEIREKDNSNGSEVFSGSSKTSSSNIHGFKMTAGKSDNHSLNAFSGKGMKINSSPRKGVSRVSSSASYSSRESFLKKIENDIQKNKGTKRTLEKTEFGSNASTDDQSKTGKLRRNFKNDKTEKTPKGYESTPNNNNAKIIATINNLTGTNSLVPKHPSKYNSTSDVICIDDSDDDEILSSIDETILSDVGVDDKQSNEGKSEKWIPKGEDSEDDEFLSTIDEILLNSSTENDISNNNQRFSKGSTNLVDCPACPAKVAENELNEHLDKCLALK